jgi:Protein of unknown function (DUF1592)/Protein of unknown function (DUF1588)/Protein of unknown function (DUF1585)/Protein of unknown function (DUF1595)/Protein of unknown function (DUF1587)
MKKRTHISLLTGVFMSALAAGCYLMSPEEGSQPEPFVAKAPLRRLSNSEYLNALSDLFKVAPTALPPLPKDTEVVGFDNAAEVQQPSELRIARFEAIANLYAEAATGSEPALREWVHCDWRAPMQGAEDCGAQFVREAGFVFFRRPLTQDELGRFVLRFDTWKRAVDFEAAVRLTLSAFLQSPQFLYRPEAETSVGDAARRSRTAAVEPYAMASRLSFFLWESVPDADLLTAAKDNALQTPQQIRAQATRMLKDPRARRALWSFHRQWLGLDRILGDEHTFRVPSIDPGWSSATPTSAQRESQLLVENVLTDNGTLTDLLMSRRAWVNADMARVYGVSLPDGAESTWTEVSLPEEQRAGILTRSAFLAGLSHRGGNSPPIRGNGVALRLLCQAPSSPPPGADLSMPQAAPGDGPKTTRTLFEERTSPATCMQCHQSLNGIGFGFEHYNAAGGYQTSDQGLPINTQGVILGTERVQSFDGAIQLSKILSESTAVHHCATERWLRYAFGRDLAKEEAQVLEKLALEFYKNGGDVKALLLEIAVSPSFRLRNVGGAQ